MNGESDRYYSIGVVAKMLGINQQTIRMYEQRGLIHPERTSGNTRMFSEQDVQTIRIILRLTQEMGVNLAGIEIILRLNEQIRELQIRHEYLVRLLFEAGNWVRDLLESSSVTDTPVKSSLGQLLKFIQVK